MPRARAFSPCTNIERRRRAREPMAASSILLRRRCQIDSATQRGRGNRAAANRMPPTGMRCASSIWHLASARSSLAAIVTGSARRSNVRTWGKRAGAGHRTDLAPQELPRAAFAIILSGRARVDGRGFQALN